MKKWSIVAILATLFLSPTLHAQTAHGRIKSDGFYNTQTISITGATPSVSVGNVFRTANVGSTTITNFVGGVDSQEIAVICGDTLTTIATDSTITLTVSPFVCTVNAAIKFVYRGDTGMWVQIGGGSSGGGGGSPSGNNGDVQIRNGGIFSAGHINDANSELNLSEDVIHTGPNPYIDIRSKGARAVSPTVVPAIPGITASCTGGSPNVTISSASTFQNGDGVALYGCGPLNANTPAAPVVSPMVAASQTGTYSAVAAPAGSTTYCYQLVSRTFMGGTAVSPETCTTTGPASLGVQSVAITSVSLSNNTATYTTAAPHGLVAGAFVNIGGVSTAEYGPSGGSAFNCFCQVASTADNTHFVVNLMIDTRAGSISSGTGGTVYYWNGIQISTTETTNNYQYYVYGRVSGGTKTLIGAMLPQNHALLGNSQFYLLWDDFGSTVSSFPTPPSYIPTTVPTTATNDMLASTIVSGAGTTSLVLANNATNTNSGQTILFDDAVSFLAAMNAEFTAGTSGPVTIPSTGANNTYFVFNSPIQLPSGGQRAVVQQNGQIWVNEPIILGAGPSRWMGGTPSTAIAPGFTQQVQTGITCNKAAPCIYALTNTNFSDIAFLENKQNGATSMFLQDSGGIPTSKFYNISWVGYPGSNTFSNTAAVFRGHSGADMQFVNNTLTASQNGSLTAQTPGMFFNEMTNLKFDWFYESGVGVAIYPNTQGAGMYLKVNELYCQACYMPDFSITGNGPVYASIDNAISDTTFNGPVLASYAGAKLSFKGSAAGGLTGISSSNSGASIGPQINNQDLNASGLLAPVVLMPGGTAIFSHNTPMTVNDGTFGRIQIGLDTMSRSLSLQPGYSIFTNIASPAAPTCTLSAGGSLTVGTPLYIFYSPIFVTGSEGQPSQYCTITPTTGNQTVTATVPTFVAGSQGTYAWYLGTLPNQTTSCGIFGNGFTFSTNSPCNGAGLGGGPLNASGGPTGMSGLAAWTVYELLGRAPSVPSGQANAVLLYMDPSSLWPTMKPNGNTPYSLAGWTGTIVNNQLACSIGTSGILNSCGTAGPATTWTGNQTIANGNELHFISSDLTHYAGFKGGASTTNLVWLFPSTDSTGTQCMSSNGSLQLSWSACSGGTSTPGGSSTQVQYNNAGSFGGGNAFTFDGTSVLGLGHTGVTGTLNIIGSTSGNVNILAQAVAGTPTLTLPNTTGTFAVGASAPLVLSATTGNLTCPTCLTTAVSTFGATSSVSPLLTTSVSNPTTTPFLTISLNNAGAHSYFGNNTGSSGAPAYVNITAADLPVTTVETNQANTYSTGIQDFSLSTMLKARNSAGLTTSANGDFGYDSTNGNWHAWNGADLIMAPLASGFVSGHCGQPTSASGKWTIVDAGAACGSGGGGTPGGATFSVQYNNAGAFGGVLPPTVAGNYVLTMGMPTGSYVAPTFQLSGVPVNAQTGSYPLLFSDRASYIKESGGTTATLTLPQITGNTASNFPFVTQNLNSGNITITANAADKIDGSAIGGSTTVLPKFAAFVYQDSSSAPGNWWTLNLPTFSAFGPTCNLILNWSTTTGFTCNSATGGMFANFTAHQFLGNNTGSSIAPSPSLIGASDYSPNTWGGTSGGTGAAYTATPAVTCTSLVAGLRFSFYPIANNSSTTPTLNACGLGVKNITKLGTSALALNDMITTALADVEYDGTQWELQNPITNPASSIALSGITNALASDTLSNGDFPIVWNWTATTTGRSAFTIGEASAGTSTGTPFLLNVQTLNTSTLNPLVVTAQGTANGFEVTKNAVIEAIGTGAFAIGGTAHGLLVSEGATTAVNALAVGTTNQVLLGSTGADPVWGTVPNAALTNSSTTVAGNVCSLGGSCSITLDQIGNSAVSKTFTQGANTLSLQTTSALSQFLSLKNTTAAVVGTSQGSPILSSCGTAFHGSASVEDCLTLSELPGNGNDAAITFSIGHTGTSTGIVTTAFPGPIQLTGSAGATSSASAMIAYDTTNKNTHIYANGADGLAAAFASAPTNKQMVSATVSSGNVLLTGIDFPERYYVPSANCNNTTAGAGWSIGAGGTVTCKAGTNNKGGFIAITDTSTTFAQFTVTIPEDWDTGTNPSVRFYLGYPGVDTGHTIIPAIQVSCSKGDGTTTDDVTFNAAHSSSTITTNATANQFWSNSFLLMNGTDVTGCVAGAQMTISVQRAADTATSAANFYGVDVTFARLLTVGAE